MGFPRQQRPPAALTVLVVDTEPLFAEGVREQLAGSREVRYQGRVAKVRDVLPTCARLAPGLVLLDAGIDRSGYLAGTLKALPHGPLLAVLVPEVAGGAAQTERSLAAGADLVLPRSVSAAELLAGIERVRRRAPVVHPALSVRRDHPPRPAPPAITHRQFEVLCLMADGKRNETIAEELFVAPETVRTHVKGIRYALRATSRAHAVSRAFQLGLLPVEPLVEQPAVPTAR